MVLFALLRLNTFRQTVKKRKEKKKKKEQVVFVLFTPFNTPLLGHQRAGRLYDNPFWPFIGSDDLTFGRIKRDTNEISCDIFMSSSNF